MKEREILELTEETGLYKNIDWSDYYDFTLSRVDNDNNIYDLYITRSEYTMTGDGHFECSDKLEIDEESWVGQQILRYKNIYNIRNIIRKRLCKQ